MFRAWRRGMWQATLLVFLCGSIVLAQGQRDIVNGNLIQFNDNGAWCWYQDERAVVDLDGGRLIVGSDASGYGFGGSGRNGSIEAVIFDLQSGVSQRYSLAKFSCDDHNAPAFLVRPDGKYLTMYAQHYDAYNSRYRIFDGGAWTREQRFDWTTIPGGTDYTIAYSNLYYLASEGRVYNFARANHRCPNLLVSTDLGDTWAYGGILATNTSNTYNKGYYRYWGNGVDRIDFIFTEQHPRDTMTSIYHGYVKGGKSYASDGTLADDNIFDTLNVPSFGNFTRVFGDNTMLNGYLMKRCWNTDVVRYHDGTIVTIATARTDQYIGSDVSINPQHAFIYCRYDGSSWSHTYLGKAGPKLYSSEADYTGNAAVHPTDPRIIYISTTVDPRDSTVNLGVREIFRGRTDDAGKTWTWTPITQMSVQDNIRPVVPKWDSQNSALLWWRGSYASAQSYNAAIVGVLDRFEGISPMTYADATPQNTRLATGDPLSASGPDSLPGVADGRWHQRLGFGNGNTVFTASEVGGENAPLLVTRTASPTPGTYDLWVNFWANPAADWRIKAGLSTGGMQVFRQMACKSVSAGDHGTPVILTDSGNVFLYQAYLGRIVMGVGDSFTAYIDDEAIRTGTTGTLDGNTARTWYDGISYASVGPLVSVPGNRVVPGEITLSQNYPNPFNPATVIRFTIPGDRGQGPGSNGGTRHATSLRVYDLLGREVAELVNEQKGAGTYEVPFDARRLASGVYLYRLEWGGRVSVRKMIHVK